MKLFRLVCFEFGVDVDDLFKSKLSHKASQARKVIIYLLYNTTMQPSDIVLKLGLDSTRLVYYSNEWVRDNIAINKKLKQKVESIKQELKNENKI